MTDRDAAQRSHDMSFRAASLIASCESDLKRRLSQGERRDLLSDNTDWTRDDIEAVVAGLTPARSRFMSGLSVWTNA